MIRRLSKNFLKAIVGIVICVPSICLGDSTPYGNFTGSSVMFLDVTESAIGPPPSNYGAPTVVGNSLRFLTPGFVSDSPRNSSDLLDGRLNFTVVANPGTFITSISLAEFGDYFTFGPGSVAFVAAGGFATVGNTTFNNSFSFLAPPPAGSPPISNGSWTGGFVINLPNATQVDFVLDNRLFTVGADVLGGRGFIDKKGLSVSIGTTVIPEPSSLMLLLFGLSVGVAGTRRRLAA